MNLGEDVEQGPAASVLSKDSDAHKDQLSSKKAKAALRALQSATVLHPYPNSLPVPKSTIKLA